MNMSNNNSLNILNLPNELLLIIINKLNMADVFYSLVDVTVRLNQMVFDPLYVRHVNMRSMKIKSLYDRIDSSDDHVLEKLCKDILPRISYHINELIVDQSSIGHVLNNISYPKLYSLTFVDFETEVLTSYLTSNRNLQEHLFEQITHVKIDIKDYPTTPSPEILSLIFAVILSLCKRLIELNFCQLYHRATSCSFQSLSSVNLKSSSLTVLKVYVQTFDDCLYLLDGRFNCLSKLVIYVKLISYLSGTIDNTRKLSKLKQFSLTSYPHILSYDNLIPPLLRRMTNLENLTLYLSIIRNNKNYIDGNELYDDILVDMIRLNKFTFNICTYVDEKNDQINFSSNTDIQRSFDRKQYGSVGSYVESFEKENEHKCHSHSLPHKFKRRCHIYSLPYQFKRFYHLNNSFPGGMFYSVQSVLVTDCWSFEHNFFKVISQSFPLLKKLHIFNEEPQKSKQQSIPLIIFSHLLLLNLKEAHADYAEQFLVDKHCHLPCLFKLSIRYESLALVTNNFTNDATRLTCKKLTNLSIEEPFVPPETFSQYFPLL